MHRSKDSDDRISERIFHNNSNALYDFSFYIYKLHNSYSDFSQILKANFPLMINFQIQDYFQLST